MKNTIKAMFHGRDITEDEIRKTKEKLFFINDKLSLIMKEYSISYNEACEAFNRLTNDCIDEKIVISDKTSSYVEPYRPARVKCIYCDCVNNKDYGTCDFCGAPLKI